MRDRTRHAPNHAGGFVLRDHGAAGGDQLGRPIGPVATHAGEHERQALGAPDLGRGAEQRIDRRLAEVDHRAIKDCNRGLAATPIHPHVLSAGRNVNLTGADRLAIDPFVRDPPARA